MMLEHCHACVVGKDEEHDYDLKQMAGILGFTSVSSLFRKGVPRIDANQTRLSFFLVHYRLNSRALESVLAAVRHSESDLIRFSPLVMLLDDGPYEMVLRYIRLGFDDVIALPERRDMVASRLRNQLEQEFTYFSTPTYHGPDRRRMERPEDLQVERRGVIQPHTRHTIIRSVEGTRVLRKEVIGEAPDAASHHVRVARRVA